MIWIKPIPIKNRSFGQIFQGSPMVMMLALALLGACSGNGPDLAWRRKGSQAGPILPEHTVFTLPTSNLRRLTQAEYMHTVQDLLGTETVGSFVIQADASLPKQFSTAVATTISMTPSDVGQYEKAANTLAKARFATPEFGQAFLGCMLQADKEDPCLISWLERFGPRLFRRPLAEGELDRYVTLYQDGLERNRNPWQAAQALLASMLLSPKFLYRAELGGPAFQGQNNQMIRQLNGFEMASRLSFFLWQTTPHQALLDGAAMGELDTKEGIARWGQRMLADERARGAVVAYFQEWLNTQYLEQLSKSPTLYPKFNQALAQAMKQELAYVVQHVVLDEKSSVRSLFQSPKTFLNPLLAQHYGVPLQGGSNMESNDFQPHTFASSSGRLGYLTMASFLAAQSPAERTSPTARGLFIRSELLCQDLPEAPPNVPALPSEMTTPIAKTMRQKLLEHQLNANCASCHQQMDPMGLALEHFDTTGAYRADDQGLPIDASGDLDGVAFQDAMGLSLALAQHERLLPCFAKKLYTYALGQPPKEESMLLPMVEAMAASGESFESLLEALITSDAFRFVGVQP